MILYFISGLPVIHHATSYALADMVNILAALTVITIFMVSGYGKRIPMIRLLTAAAAFFLFFSIGSRLFALTSDEWHLLFARGRWPAAANSSLLGGLTGLMACFFIYILWLRSSMKIFDILAMVLPAGISIQRIACLLSGCCFGIPTSLPWGIRYDHNSHAFNVQVCSGYITDTDPYSLPVHPTQVYDIIAWLIILLLAARMAGHFRAHGSRFILTLILYGIFRFFLEFLRDPIYDLHPGSYGGIKFIQWMIMAVVFLLACILMAMERRRVPARHKEMPGEETFERHFILILIVVSLFLLFRPLFNLREMVAMGLLLVSLFINSAGHIFKIIVADEFNRGRVLLLTGILVSGISTI